MTAGSDPNTKLLSPNGKSKELAVVQSITLDTSTIPFWCWDPSTVPESCQFLLYVGILKLQVL